MTPYLRITFVDDVTSSTICQKFEERSGKQIPKSPGDVPSSTQTPLRNSTAASSRSTKESGENKSLQRYKSPVRTFPFQFYAYHLLGPYHMLSGLSVSLCVYEKFCPLEDFWNNPKLKAQVMPSWLVLGKCHITFPFWKSYFLRYS